MQTLRIPVAQIKRPKVRVSQEYSPEAAEILKRTTERLGILTPIVVTREGADFVLVDGLHRLDQALTNHEVEVDAVVYDGDGAENLTLNLVLNSVKGRTKASEVVQVIEELTKNHGLDSDAIAARTGLSREYIEKLWKITEAAPSVREALDAEMIGVGVAFQIARLPTVAQQDYVISLQGLWRMGEREVKKLIDQTLAYMKDPVAPPAPVEAVQAALPKCEGCQTETPGKYLRTIQVCPTCYGAVYDAIKAARPPAAPQKQTVDNSIV